MFVHLDFVATDLVLSNIHTNNCVEQAEETEGKACLASTVSESGCEMWKEARLAGSSMTKVLVLGREVKPHCGLWGQLDTSLHMGPDL